MSEQALWRAVIYQALMDVEHVAGASKKWRPLLLAQARDWFKRENIDFLIVCTRAEVDEKAVRERALSIIDGSKPIIKDFEVRKRERSKTNDRKPFKT